MNIKEIQEAVKEARERAKKRNFKQTFELAVSLRDLDLKNPSNKIKLEVSLPHGTGKNKKIGAIAEGELAENAKKANIPIIIGKADLAKFAEDKKSARKIVSKVDMFIAQPDLMVDVGKILGPILGPRDMMPKPVPPKVDLKPLLLGFNKIVKLRVKDQPVVHCRVGTEDMSDEQISENVLKVLTSLSEKLPKKEKQIKASYVKLTMGPSIKIGAKKGESK